MNTRHLLTKWILGEALLLPLLTGPVPGGLIWQDTTVCCYADLKSERSILRDKSLTDEQRKVHLQKEQYMMEMRYNGVKKRKRVVNKYGGAYIEEPLEQTPNGKPK
ncbi:hypothetical protein [Fibrobacter intestinalis]|uniref:hypothetical protein n=1 Tax=Fibrobacter intestinalis TaxID=28122 RepID=UPI0023F11968|nr:hypothetical protein [Fibrobacter intestinalis]MDD7298742.1 hypothetical protein [Fibrobacter intestinalis]